MALSAVVCCPVRKISPYTVNLSVSYMCYLSDGDVFIEPSCLIAGDIREPFFRMAAHLFSSRNCWIHATATWLLASGPESVSCSH